MYDPLGLSIGTTNLVAARDGSPPVTRRAVLTLYPHCAPKIGVSDEDSGIIEPGMPMSGFVERVGDSVALVSGDGSSHDPDLLMVEALDAMVVAAGADSSSSEIAIAVPAHWKPAKIQALRNGLRTHVGFVRSGMAPRLVSDAVASLAAANAELELPDEGVFALLDFGGGGTSATLLEAMNAGADFEPICATMRCNDFSGNEIDQALLLRVFEELGHGSGIDPDSTAGVGQLGELRDQCRAAKERLSTETVTELAGVLGRRRCSMTVTRRQLEDLIQDRLNSFLYSFDDMLRRNKKSWADLAGVVTVGGCASIPLVTERLSRHGRTPVLTVSQPELAAATGGLALASRGQKLDTRTRSSIGLFTASAGSGAIELPAGDVLVIDHDAMTDRELAWSQTEWGEVPVRYSDHSYDDGGASGWSMRLNVLDEPREPAWRRLRFSQFIVGLCALVAMTAIGGVAYTLTGIENRQAPVVPTVAPRPAPPPPSAVPTVVPPPPSAAPVPTVAPIPSTEPPPPPPPAPSQPPPPVVVTTEAPPPPVVTHTQHPPPPATTAMTTQPSQPPPPPPSDTTTTPPPPPTTTSTPVPMTTEWIHVPLLPVPIPVPVPKSAAPANPAPQYPQQYPQYPQYPQQYPEYPGGGGYGQNPYSGGGY